MEHKHRKNGECKHTVENGKLIKMCGHPLFTAGIWRYECIKPCAFLEENVVNKISSNPLLCDENCDPFFIKTDEYGYCKKCFKNLGYVRK